MIADDCFAFIAYIQCSNPELLPLLKDQVPTLSALIKGSKSVEIVEAVSDVPEGCSSETVGANIVVHLLIKGMINVEQEIAKAEKKVTAAQSGIEKLKKVIAKAETPEEIKTKSAEDVKVLEAEMAALSLNIEQFSKMR